jgi:DNA-binding NarL/FixJ family response regulator
MTLPEISVAIDGGLELDRAGLAALIASLPGLRVVPIDKNAPPQVVICIRDIGANIPSFAATGAAVLLLTQDAEVESLPEGIAGLFFRDESSAALGIAIRQVARGEQYLSPSLVQAILQKRQTNQPSVGHNQSTGETLTEREREILDLLAEGLSNKMIAARLYLSVRTVEGHLATIYTRLGVHSRTEAILIANRIPKNIETTLAPPARAGVVR